MGAALVATGLSKRYGGVAAVDDVSFELAPGSVTGLIGPNGAGKTTLFNLVSGFTSKTSGEVRWEGRDVTSARPDELANLGLVRSFQHSRVFGSLSVRENIEVARHLRAPKGRLRTRRAALASDCADVLEGYGLAPLADRKAGELAYGVVRRVALAMAVATEPSLLLLDEPAAGLNAEEVALLKGDIERLRTAGVTVLLVEHHMGLVMGVSDRVLVLDAGRMIASGSPEEVANDAAVIAAYLGV